MLGLSVARGCQFGVSPLVVWILIYVSLLRHTSCIRYLLQIDLRWEESTEFLILGFLMGLLHIEFEGMLGMELVPGIWVLEGI